MSSYACVQIAEELPDSKMLKPYDVCINDLQRCCIIYSNLVGYNIEKYFDIHDIHLNSNNLHPFDCVKHQTLS